MITSLIKQEEYSKGAAARVDLKYVPFTGAAAEVLEGRTGIAIISENGDEVLLSVQALKNILSYADEGAPNGHGVIVKFSSRESILIGRAMMPALAFDSQSK